jgi:hypothetical protein
MKTTLKNLLFHVEKLLVSDVLNASTISSTEYGIFGYINGNGKRRGKPMLLNTCSNIYELVPNSSIFPVIERMLRKAKIKYSVTYRMLDYSRFYADFTLEDGAVSIGNGQDKIKPVIKIEHSYNGLLKYKMTFGWFRLICSNGLTVPVQGKEDQNFTITGKHTKEILNSLTGLLEKIAYFTKNTKEYSKKFEVMADTWVKNWEDRVLEITAATGVGLRGAKFNKKTEQFEGQIFDKIREEAAQLYKGQVNDWLIYNGINYHIFNAKTEEGKEYATAPNLRNDQDKKVLVEILAGR